MMTDRDLMLLAVAIMGGKQGPPGARGYPGAQGPPGPSGSGLVPSGIDGYAAIEIGGVIAMRPILASYIVPPFAMLSFSPVVPVVEIGATVALPAFVASCNRAPTSEILTDNVPNPPKDVTTPDPNNFSSSETFAETANNASVTFTATAHEGGASSALSAPISWQPRAYWGIGIDGGADAAFIQALPASVGGGSGLKPSLATSITLTPGALEYIYYAYPDSYGPATFSVGGFPGGFNLVSATIPVTNNGVTQNYRLYQSVNPNLGLTTVDVS